MPRRRHRKRKRSDAGQVGAKETDGGQPEGEGPSQSAASRLRLALDHVHLAHQPAQPAQQDAGCPEASIVSTFPSTPGTFSSPPRDAQVQNTLRQFWRERVEEWYPELSEKAYFLPPVFMHRTHYQRVTLSGRNVHQTLPATTSEKARGTLMDKDVREDQSHQTVVDCLWKLSRREVMFIISQLQFANYLCKGVSGLTPAGFPRPLDRKPENKHEGDFDVLVIHPRYGILAGEIKSIGENFSTVSMTPQRQADSITKRIEKACAQMQKSHEMLKYLVSDLPSPPTIHTVLMLPYVTSAQLHDVLWDPRNHQLKEALCQLVGADVTADPVPLCLTSDSVSDPDDWWQRLFGEHGEDPAMTESLYLDLVSRFGGPATTVTVNCPVTPRLAHQAEIRTPGHGVAETARRFAPVDIVLHPKQVSLLNNSDQMVFITGPPGTGKTLVLLLKGLDWLRQEKHVHVLCSQPDGLAATHLIAAQLRSTADQDTGGRIHLCNYELETAEGVQTALSELEAAEQDGELYILADEVCADRGFSQLCNKLSSKLRALHVWAASLYKEKKPACLTEYALTEPLRTPPNVVKEVKRSGYISHQSDVHCYTLPPGPPPTPGPPVESCLHDGQGHSTGTTYDCKQCGRDIAKVLKDLGVGQPASAASSSLPVEGSLRFQDVFILTHRQQLLESRPATSTMTLRPSGLLLGLREAGIPYTVLGDRDATAIEAVATMSGPDRVVVAQSNAVSGLEKPVVVWVQGDKESMDEDHGRLLAMSRTTAQLIWVRRPP